MLIKIFIILLLSFTLSADVIYLEEVIDCVQNTCESVRRTCGIDSDCRQSYNNFTTCINQQSSESTYIQCRTNGFMTWVSVMDCYNGCHYFELVNSIIKLGFVFIILLQ